jgi:hypothetical protein
MARRGASLAGLGQFHSIFSPSASGRSDRPRDCRIPDRPWRVTRGAA